MSIEPSGFVTNFMDRCGFRGASQIADSPTRGRRSGFENSRSLLWESSPFQKFLLWESSPFQIFGGLFCEGRLGIGASRGDEVGLLAGAIPFTEALTTPLKPIPPTRDIASIPMTGEAPCQNPAHPRKHPRADAVTGLCLNEKPASTGRAGQGCDSRSWDARWAIRRPERSL